MFSKGTEQKARSVGRIKVEYSFDDFGAESFTDGSGVLYKHDFTANVSLHEGSSKEARELKSWRAYDYDAGIYGKEYVIFFSEKLEDRDEKLDASKFTSNIGSEGLYLNFYVDADKNGHHVYASRGIAWPYSEMAKVLIKKNTSNATGKDGAAPKQGKQMKFLLGSSGIEYDVANDKCSDAADGCGKDPHTGYKFTFSYDWVDDEDVY